MNRQIKALEDEMARIAANSAIACQLASIPGYAKNGDQPHERVLRFSDRATMHGHVEAYREAMPSAGYPWLDRLPLPRRAGWCAQGQGPTYADRIPDGHGTLVMVRLAR